MSILNKLRSLLSGDNNSVFFIKDLSEYTVYTKCTKCLKHRFGAMDCIEFEKVTLDYDKMLKLCAKYQLDYRMFPSNICNNCLAVDTKFYDLLLLFPNNLYDAYKNEEAKEMDLKEASSLYNADKYRNGYYKSCYVHINKLLESKKS